MYILKIVFDWIFPPSEEEMCVRTLNTDSLQELFNPKNFEGSVALSSFKNRKIRALIHEAKFHNNKSAQTFLNILISKYLKEAKNQYDVVIPIPLSKKRQRERGYNQVTSILKSSELTIPVEIDALHRIKHTRPQTDLSKEKREENMRDAFGVMHPGRIKNKQILLVDDVITTGATLRAAKAALLPHRPVSVICLALAH